MCLKKKTWDILYHIVFFNIEVFFIAVSHIPGFYCLFLCFEDCFYPVWMDNLLSGSSACPCKGFLEKRSTQCWDLCLLLLIQGMSTNCCIMPEFRENKPEFLKVSLHLCCLLFHPLSVWKSTYCFESLRSWMWRKWTLILVIDFNFNICCQSPTLETLLVVIPNHGFPLFYRTIQSLAEKEHFLSW